MYQKGYTYIAITILISIMAVGLVGAAWYYEENKEETSSSTPTTQTDANIALIENTNTIINANTNVDIQEGILEQKCPEGIFEERNNTYNP